MLDKRRKKFCEHFVGDCVGNIKQSAIKAGYSRGYAEKQSYKLLVNLEVQAYIKELNSSDYKIATVQDIRRFWTEIMNDKTQNTVVRIKASELLAKTKGMFNNESW